MAGLMQVQCHSPRRGPHLLATLLQGTGLRLVCPGWDVHLGMEGAAASHEWALLCPWSLLPQQANPHLQDDSHNREVQGLPRHGGRPLVDLVTHYGRRWLVLGACLPKPLGSTANDETSPVAPGGHLPASRQGASLSKYSGATRLSSAWNSRMKGRRDTSTRDCRARGASEMSPNPSGVCRDP